MHRSVEIDACRVSTALGEDAVDQIGAHLDRVRADLDRWADLSRSTALSGVAYR
jgi:hypothetical protein